MAQKIAFFKELFQLDEDEDETEDPNDAAVILRQFNIPCKPPHREERSFLGPRIKPRIPTPPPVEVSSPVKSPPVHVPVPSVRSTPLKMVPPAKRLSKSKGKRKRGECLELLPDSQQIFKGLAFYFIPNNDVSPCRRFRIKKVMERGALWVREWRTDVTHIIADKRLTYKDITSFLKLSSIPPGVALVTEDYPPACISYQLVLNPNQTIYHVEGFEQSMVAKDPPSLMPSDGKSVAINAVNEGLELPSEKETPLCPVPPATGSVSSKAVTEVALPKPDLESPKIGSRPTPSPRTDGTAGDGNSAGLSAKNCGSPGEPTRDALDEAIEELSAFKDLPLDFDEDLDNTETDAADSEEEHSDTEKPTMHSKRVKLQKSWQQNFSCMQKHDGKVAQNPNSRTIDILQQMLNYYGRIEDHWRTIAYRKAISALRKHPTKVMTKEQALAIPFIGERLAAKIEEIVWTDRLRRLDNTNLEPNDLTLQTFLKIYGVGLAQATKWINQGHRTISDLVSKARLTKNQLIGIQHYDDFQTRIPRKEVESHGQFLRTFIQKIDPTIQITIGGSYRRGAPDSGDVDFILTKPNCPISTLRTIIFHTVLPLLQKRNYLKATLASSTKDDNNNNNNGTKWHGAATLPGFSPVWRRVDFLLVPWDEMGAALIYFTGNDIFNRSIRLLARKKGMRLNQRGLWRDVMRGGGARTQGTLVEGKSEERIFELLGVPYRPPEHRIC